MPNPDPSDRAIQDFREALGPGQVENGTSALAREAENLTEYEALPPICVLYPKDVDQVSTAIEVANRTGTPLYPISSGFNWGLGSRLPPAGRCVLLNLSGVKRIRAIDRDFRYAVIEPGVTQRQLADALRNEAPELTMNPTGSHKDTSVVGNCLERGVGFFGGRLWDIRGIEIVLGNGRVVRTGSWRFHRDDHPRAPTHTFPPGLGPDLTGLFTQSNFGIVTAVVFDLRPRQPFTIALMEFAERDLEPVVDGLGRLRADDVISEGYEIDNELDPRVDGVGQAGKADGAADRGDRWWAVWMRLPGEGRRIDAAKASILRAIGAHCARIEFIDPETDDIETRGDAFASRVDVLTGEPTNFSLEAMARASGVATVDPAFNPDRDSRVMGFVCCLPALPYKGETVVAVLDIVEDISQRHDVRAALTMSGMSALTLEGFFRTYFDRRDPAATARAHAWNRDLHRALAEIGIYPYRVNIAQMSDYFVDDGTDDTHVLKDLKALFDPNGIIAPGRYSVL